MAMCSAETGLLFWKGVCGKASFSHCTECSNVVCQDHRRSYRGSYLCQPCHDDKTSDNSSADSSDASSDDNSWFSSSSSDSDTSSSDSGSDSSSSD